MITEAVITTFLWKVFFFLVNARKTQLLCFWKVTNTFILREGINSVAGGALDGKHAKNSTEDFFSPNRLLRRNAQLACYSFCISSRSFWWVIWGHGLETFQSWKDEYMLEHMEDGLKRWPSSYTKKLTRVQFPDLKSGSSPLSFTPDPGVWHSLPASTDTHACAHGHRNTEIYAHKI